MKTRARRTSEFLYCFLLFRYPGGTRVRVVYIASQISTTFEHLMERDFVWPDSLITIVVHK